MLPPQGRRVYCSLYLQQSSPAYLSPWLALFLQDFALLSSACRAGLQKTLSLDSPAFFLILFSLLPSRHLPPADMGVCPQPECPSAP